MTARQTFTALVEKHGSLNAAFITLPFDMEKTFGSKRPPVRVEVNQAAYRGKAVKMGGRFVVGMPTAFRGDAKISIGGYIVFTSDRNARG